MLMYTILVSKNYLLDRNIILSENKQKFLLKAKTFILLITFIKNMKSILCTFNLIFCKKKLKNTRNASKVIPLILFTYDARGSVRVEISLPINFFLFF